MLEKRIHSFVKRGEQMLEQQHVHSPYIEHHITDLQERWNEFKQQVEETRRLIDLSIRYFQLVLEVRNAVNVCRFEPNEFLLQANEWFKEGGRVLMMITRKARAVKTPEEAQTLLNEIELFLKPGESKQNERIEKISELACEIFDLETAPQVKDVLVQNSDMKDSFSAIREELNVLARNLKDAEEKRERERKEKEEEMAKLEAARAEALAAEKLARAEALAAEKARAAEEARRQAEKEAEAEAETLRKKQKQIEIIEITNINEVPVIEETSAKESKVEIVEIFDKSPKLDSPRFTVPLSDAVIEEGKFRDHCNFSFAFVLEVV